MGSISYNPMTLIKLNFDSTIAIFGNFHHWSKNEEFAMKRVKRKHRDEKILLFNVIKDMSFNKPITNEIIESYANQYGVDVVNFYMHPNFSTLDERGLEQFHIKKAYILSNCDDYDDLMKCNFDKKVFHYIKGCNPLWKKAQKALKEGNPFKYCNLTGFNYSFKGPVAEGLKIGTTIGYPTANINTDGLLPLKKAVYISNVKLPNDKNVYKGISAYWTNSKGVEVFETHILDFDKMIYGWFIQVELVEYIRESKKVDSLDELVVLLNDDKKRCIEYFEGKETWNQ